MFSKISYQNSTNTECSASAEFLNACTNLKRSERSINRLRILNQTHFLLAVKFLPGGGVDEVF